MKFPTVLLWINAAFFLVFGALFLVAPGVFAELLTGATPATTNALIDIRATYGGMALGIGLFFAFCARQHIGADRPDRFPAGSSGDRVRDG